MMKKMWLILVTCLIFCLTVGCATRPPAGNSTKAIGGWEIEEAGIVTIMAEVGSDLIGKELTIKLTDFGDNSHSIQYTPDKTSFSVPIAITEKGNYFPQVMLLDADITDKVRISYSQEIPIPETPSTDIVLL